MTIKGMDVKQVGHIKGEVDQLTEQLSGVVDEARAYQQRQRARWFNSHAGERFTVAVDVLEDAVGNLVNASNNLEEVITEGEPE
jgi:hypothetical protein